MKLVGQIIVLFFLTSNCYAQINRDSIKTTGYFAGTKATVEIGMNAPLGKLSKVLKPNLLVGFSIDIPTTNAPKKLFGFNAIIFLTENAALFSYKLNDTLLVTHAIKTGFIGGIHYTYRSYIKEKYIVDKIIGIGLGVLSTNIKKNNPENKNDKYYALQALNLNAGISLKRAITKNTRLGLKLLYNFTAYSLFNKSISNNFGSQSLSTSINFTF